MFLNVLGRKEGEQQRQQQTLTGSGGGGGGASVLPGRPAVTVRARTGRHSTGARLQRFKVKTRPRWETMTVRRQKTHLRARCTAFLQQQQQQQLSHGRSPGRSISIIQQITFNSDRHSLIPNARAGIEARDVEGSPPERTPDN